MTQNASSFASLAYPAPAATANAGEFAKGDLIDDMPSPLTLTHEFGDARFDEATPVHPTVPASAHTATPCDSAPKNITAARFVEAARTVIGADVFDRMVQPSLVAIDLVAIDLVDLDLVDLDLVDLDRGDSPDASVPLDGDANPADLVNGLADGLVDGLVDGLIDSDAERAKAAATIRLVTPHRFVREFLERRHGRDLKEAAAAIGLALIFVDRADVPAFNPTTPGVRSDSSGPSHNAPFDTANATVSNATESRTDSMNSVATVTGSFASDGSCASDRLDSTTDPSNALAALPGDNVSDDWRERLQVANRRSAAATRDGLPVAPNDAGMVAQGLNAQSPTASPVETSATLTTGFASGYASGYATGFAPNPAPSHKPNRKHAPTSHPFPNHHQNHTLDRFIVGATNRLAYHAATAIAGGIMPPDAPPGMGAIDPDLPLLPPVVPTPLVLHGPCGVGKTHLLRGACLAARKRDRRAAVKYMTAEAFTNAYIDALLNGRIEKFRREIRSLDLLAIDDVQFMAGKKKTLDEFYHCLDALAGRGQRVMLAMDCHPKQMRKCTEALISRCVAGLVVEVGTPDEDQRHRMAEAMAAREGLVIAAEAMDLVVRRGGTTARELQGTISRLALLARASGMGHSGRPIDRGLIHRILRADEAARPLRPVGVPEILVAVQTATGVTPAQVRSRGRSQPVVIARELVVHLTRRHTALSFPELAERLDRTGHSTLVTADQRFTARLENDPLVRVPNCGEKVRVSRLLDDARRALMQD